MGETIQRPLVTCLYGWGQVMRLFQDRLEVNGTSYPLANLVYVRPVYHRFLGISSVRLEIRFTGKKVVLRGIAALAEAQHALEYMSSLCPMFPISLPGPIHSATLTRVPRPRADRSLTGQLQSVVNFSQLPDTERPGTHRRTDDLSSQSVTQTQLLLPRRPLVQGEHAQLETSSQAATAPLEIPRWQLIRQEQRLRRLRRLQSERSIREHGFDIELIAQRLREEALPRVYVPTRLLAGEIAHYSTEATLCSESPYLPNTARGYQAKDQGTLILTNKRLIYIGRKRQLVLGYARLMHVSRLRGAIAVLAENWGKREVFEVRLPLECTMYLDAIMQRFRQQRPDSPLEEPRARVRHTYALPSERFLAPGDTRPLTLPHVQRVEAQITAKLDLKQQNTSTTN